MFVRQRNAGSSEFVPLLDAGATLGRSADDTFATPLFQTKSAIFAYSHGSWTVTSYPQATEVGRDGRLGIPQGTLTCGGSVLASYAFTKMLAPAGRAEADARKAVLEAELAEAEAAATLLMPNPVGAYRERVAAPLASGCGSSEAAGSALASRLRLVAGAGFEPAAFRL